MVSPGTLLDAILQTQPAELDLLKLAEENVKDDGTLDYEAISADQERLNAAEQQLADHIRAIRNLKENLLRTADIHQ